MTGQTRRAAPEGAPLGVGVLLAAPTLTVNDLKNVTETFGFNKFGLEGLNANEKIGPR